MTGTTGSQDAGRKAAPQYCNLSPYLVNAGIDVVEHTETIANDMYIRCLWASTGAKIKVGDSIGFEISCPAGREIVNSGYFLGAFSTVHLKPTGLLAVPTAGPAPDRAQSLFYVESLHPNGLFEVNSTAMCR